MREQYYVFQKHNIALFFYFQNKHFILQYILDYYEILCPFSGSIQCRSIIDRFMQMEDKNEITSGIYR